MQIEKYKMKIERRRAILTFTLCTFQCPIKIPPNFEQIPAPFPSFSFLCVRKSLNFCILPAQLFLAIYHLISLLNIPFCGFASSRMRALVSSLALLRPFFTKSPRNFTSSSSSFIPTMNLSGYLEVIKSFQN